MHREQALVIGVITGLAYSLVALGLVCPVLAVASWGRLRQLDRSLGVQDLEVGLLQRVPMLVML